VPKSTLVRLARAKVPPRADRRRPAEATRQARHRSDTATDAATDADSDADADADSDSDSDSDADAASDADPLPSSHPEFAPELGLGCGQAPTERRQQTPQLCMGLGREVR
jgi:hypothetical protein